MSISTKNVRIAETIKDYLASEVTDYAVMITGDWGAGKTYFWTNQIIPIAEELGLKPVYVSLYGLQAPEDINRLFAYALMPILDTKFAKGAGFVLGGIASYFKVNLKDFKPTDFVTTFKKIVVCFDDLERISSKANVEDVLGYINRFVEHQNVKTLIISNEAELRKVRNKDGSDALTKAEVDRYAIVKEKLVGWTLELETDIDQIIDMLVAEDVSGIVGPHYENNRKLFHSFSPKDIALNVRSIKIAGNVFRTVLEELKAENVNLHGLESDLLRVLLFCTVESKKDANITPGIRGLFSGEASLIGLYLARDKPGGDAIFKLLGKYGLDTDNHAFRFRAMFDYLIGGTLDRAALVKEGQFIDQLRSKKVDPLDAYVSNQVFEMDEAEFPNTHAHYVKLVKSNSITNARTLLNLAFRMYFYASINLIDETTEQVKQLFVTSFTALKNKDVLDITTYKEHPPLFSYEGNTGFEGLHQELTAIIDLVLTKRDDDAIQRWLENLRTAPPKAFEMLEEQRLFGHIAPFLKHIDGNALSSVLLGMSISNLVEFRKWVSYRYSPNNIADWLFDEIETLRVASIQIKASKVYVGKSFLGHKLRELVSALERAISSMEARHSYLEARKVGDST